MPIADDTTLEDFGIEIYTSNDGASEYVTSQVIGTAGVWAGGQLFEVPISVIDSGSSVSAVGEIYYDGANDTLFFRGLRTYGNMMYLANNGREGVILDWIELHW